MTTKNEPSSAVVRDESRPPPGYEIHHYTPGEHGVNREHWRIRVKGYALMSTFVLIEDALRSAWIIHDEHDANPGRSEEDITQPFEHEIFVLTKKIEKVLEIATSDIGCDGAHHKQWFLDQVIRALTGDAYEDWVQQHCDGEDGPETYEWDEGIPP